MFDALTRLALRRSGSVLVLTALFVAGSLAYGLGVVGSLGTGGQTDPRSESARAGVLLDERFPAARPDLVLLVRPGAGGVDDPAVAAAGIRLAARLAAEPGVAGVTSYWGTGAPGLRARDGAQALVAARLAGNPTRAQRRLRELRPAYEGERDGLRVTIGGATAVRGEVTDTIRADIAKAEAIGIPLTALVLFVVFGSVLAALLPLMVGIIAVIGTAAGLRLLGESTDVSIFSINLATGLSLGLAADYGLFIVRRYREECRRGAELEVALRTTLHTAGRTVAFSSLTVGVSVSAMLVFPLYFLRSFAYAGILVVLLAALAALVALPAALVALGPHVDALDLSQAARWALGPLRRRRKPRPAARPSGWRRVAEAVLRRPVLSAVASTLLLLALGLPFLRVSFGLPDDRLLPVDFDSHVVAQSLRDDFDSDAAGGLYVLLPGLDPAGAAAPLRAYATRLSEVDGVVRVSTAVGDFRAGAGSPPTARSPGHAAGDLTYLAVDSRVEVVSTEGQRLVSALRAVPAPVPAQVAGPSADLLDARTALSRWLPVAIGIIAVTSLVLLFLLTGSVLIPIKALAMNTLSVSATFGVLVWIFQDHHLAGLLHFQETGWVDVTLLVLLFCVAFGVSMDYEVFLLSRIREEYARTGDNRSAVVFGVEKTGGVVTAAALITSIVFVAMGTAQVTNIKMFGVGLAFAVLLDATVVRTVLAPALLRLAGEANWWAPRPLRVLHERWGLRAGDDDPVEPPLPVGAR